MMRALLAIVLFALAAHADQPPPLTRVKPSGVLKIGSTPPTSVDVGDVSLRTGVGGILLREKGSLVLGKTTGPFEATLDYRIVEDELLVSVEADDKLLVTADGAVRTRVPTSFKVAGSPRRVVLRRPGSEEALSLILFFEPLVPGPAKGVLKVAPRPSPTTMTARVPGEMRVGCLLTLDASSEPRMVNVLYEISGEKVRCSITPATIEP